MDAALRHRARADPQTVLAEIGPQFASSEDLQRLEARLLALDQAFEELKAARRKPGRPRKRRQGPGHPA